MDLFIVHYNAKKNRTGGEHGFFVTFIAARRAAVRHHVVVLLPIPLRNQKINT
jgi:hypothetical protein